jgi:hypothetical protein
LRVGDPTFLLDEEELVDVVPSIDPTFYLFESFWHIEPHEDLLHQLFARWNDDYPISEHT